MSASVPLTYRCYCVSLDVFIYLRRSLYTVDVGTSVLLTPNYYYLSVDISIFRCGGYLHTFRSHLIP